MGSYEWWFGKPKLGDFIQGVDHFVMSESFVSITCGLFQGTFEADMTHERVVSCMEQIHIQKGYRRRDGMIRGLHVSSVKFARKGRLGDVLFLWNFPDPFKIPEHIMENVGSIQISCRTVPLNHKVSAFIFANGKIKLCGKMIDPMVSVNDRLSEIDVTKDHDVIHEAMQRYLNEVKECVCDFIGAIPKEPWFNPGIIHGQFNFGMHIQGINELSIYAAREARDLFSYVRGQEPEIRARSFAIQLYMKDNEKMHISFDHKGKVQIFNTKGYRDMRRCCDVFLDLISRAIEDNIITVSDL